MKEFIVSNTDAQKEWMVSMIKKDREAIAKMEAHMEDLSSTISTSAAAMFFKQSNAPPRLQEIHRKLCILPALSNDCLLYTSDAADD